ncbi:MAG TPA: permease-like cell division protein FtsX [Thermoanaerobaculia bacterium]|nr:permease-like cell division protein FtsX [Thermoanaerobaculia bacterium]
MSFLQALRYFTREALVNLLRSWKVSLLAVATIAVSLVLGGTFLLASRNLSASVEHWRGEMRVVIYLRPDAPARDLARLAAEARRAPWVASAQAIPAQRARQRFKEIFPGLADLVEGWDGEPLPASIEVGFRPGAIGPARAPAGFAPWLESWRRRPEVAMVDDDREWLGKLETVVAVVRGMGLVLGGILLGAAIFTIASIIRLTAYLHHEEMAIMRLVGATEFFIRGPFFVEGLLQGLIGGAAAGASLYAAFRLIHAQTPPSLFASVLAARFLTLQQLAILILLGGLAGLVGAVASLRRQA